MCTAGGGGLLKYGGPTHGGLELLCFLLWGDAEHNKADLYSKSELHMHLKSFGQFSNEIVN